MGGNVAVDVGVVLRHMPLLLEYAGRDMFRVHIFPIPANGSRTVRVQYVSELIGGKDAPAYILPLKFKQKLPKFSLRVEVDKPVAPPTVAKGGPANFGSLDLWVDDLGEGPGAAFSFFPPAFTSRAPC